MNKVWTNFFTINNKLFIFCIFTNFYASQSNLVAASSSDGLGSGLNKIEEARRRQLDDIVINRSVERSRVIPSSASALVSGANLVSVSKLSATTNNGDYNASVSGSGNLEAQHRNDALAVAASFQSLLKSNQDRENNTAVSFAPDLLRGSTPANIIHQELLAQREDQGSARRRVLSSRPGSARVRDFQRRIENGTAHFMAPTQSSARRAAANNDERNTPRDTSRYDPLKQPNHKHKSTVGGVAGTFGKN